MAPTDVVCRSIALRSIPGIGDRLFLRLVEHCGGAAAVFAADPEKLRSVGLREETVRAIRAFRDWSAVEREIERAGAAGASMVALEDSAYPTALRHTYDPPPVLYVRGRLVRDDLQAVAVVGARDASPYGLAAAERIAGEIAARGVTIVSGLALGIDGAAHRGALGARGRTIAVLGSGIDRVYPYRHRRLAEEVVEHGAVLSEFACGTPAARENFPRRNRVVSGLALATVVVEAGEKSGSLITARLAAEQGREVFAVPGPINAARTRGTHRLLRTGAALAESGDDVIAGALPWLLEKPPPTVQTERPPDASDRERQSILKGFREESMHVDDLIERSGLPAPRVLELLLEMELEGRIRRHPGMFFSKRSGAGS